MHFTVDTGLLLKARDVLADRRRIYWVVGGSCVGKSTLCRALAARCNLALVDMDLAIFDTYRRRYRPERHPANSFWFAKGNGLGWVLSLSPDEFDKFNRAADAEYLDLLADDLEANPPERALVVDGGISHPGILAQVLPPRQIACLEIPEALGSRIWQEDPDRQGMKDAVLSLPNPEEMWAKFIWLDTLMRRNIAAECRANDIPIFARTASTCVDELAEPIMQWFGLGDE